MIGDRFLAVSPVAAFKISFIILSRHDPTTHDATPLPPNARRDTTNVRLKLWAFALCSPLYYFSNLEPATLGISPSEPRLYLVPPHYRKPQYRNDITSRLSLSLDIVPFPLSLRLFLNSEVTPHFPTVASSLLHRRDTVPPLTKISNKDLSIILHMPLHTLAYTVCGRFSHTGLIPVFDPGFRIP